MKTRRQILAAMLGCFAATAIQGPVSQALASEGWPDKPVRIIVSFPPGGSSDLVARLLAQHLTESFGQQFVVENKPGAAGTVAATALKEAAADGYTFMLSNLTPFSVAPTQFPETPYDPIRDFAHVSYIGTVHLGLFVKPELKTADLASFVGLAKKEPGKYDYGTSGVGSWGHIIAARFGELAGVDMVHIPYKGSGPMRLDFTAGVVPAIFDAVPQNLPAVEEGAAVPLAVTATERLANLPDVPTFVELGYDIVAENWLGFSAPAGLDAAISGKLDAELQQIMELPEVTAQFDTWGLVRSPKSTAEFAEYVARQYESWKPLVKAVAGQ